MEASGSKGGRELRPHTAWGGGRLHVEPFESYEVSIPRALEAIGAPAVFAEQTRVIIKPNLVNASPPPVTLPVEAAAALVRAVRSWSDAEVVIAEGCGDCALSTGEVFRSLGYDRLAKELAVELLDLNEAPLVRLEDPACGIFPEFWLPKVLLEGFLVSAPVLKAHSLAGVTLSLKNMMGAAPPAHYQRGGVWKKSAFHARMHPSIYELNRYRRPDLAVVDGSVGLAHHHLGGPSCEPLVGKILCGFDPVAVDAAGAALLGRDWRGVEHIDLAHGILGRAE